MLHVKDQRDFEEREIPASLAAGAWWSEPRRKLNRQHVETARACRIRGRGDSSASLLFYPKLVFFVWM